MDRETQTALNTIELQLRRIAYALETRLVTESRPDSFSRFCRGCGCGLIVEYATHCPVCGAPLKGATDVSGG